jgi:sugar phosphate isomerase/epimerase
MPLSWTFSTLGCPEFSFEEIADLADSFDLNLLEVRAVSGRMDLAVLLQERFGEASTMASWLKKRNLRIQSLDTSARLVAGSDESWEELLELAKWADAINCPYLRVFDGGTKTREISEAELGQAVNKIGEWRAYRDGHGLRADIIVETHNNLVTASSIRRLQEALGDEPLKILWDAHHTWRFGGEDPFATWKSIAPWVHHIHVKDSRTDSGESGGFAYCHVGEGDFPFVRCVQTLEKEGYTGAVSLEWEKAWHPDLAPLEVALQRLFSVIA